MRQGTPRAAGLLQAAMDEAGRRLADPQLSPAAVATSVGISTRYLHQLFSDSGASFRRWLLARRLELARHDLADPAEYARNIGEIALACGFHDPSYFARAFRSRYGVSPSEFRTNGDGTGDSASSC